MADASSAQDEVDSLSETPTQKAARLRRERREAKIKAGGTDRLNKIMNISGRTGPPPETAQNSSAPDFQPSPQPAAPQSAIRQPQPLAAPKNNPDEDSQTQLLQQMMQQMITGAPNHPQHGDPDTSVPPGNGRPFPPNAQGDPNEDPMLKLMQQLMGGQMPPEMASVTQQSQQPQSTSAWAWRITHAAFAFFLAIYISRANSFTGSKAARETEGGFGGSAGSIAQRPFYIFATTELVLQSTRFFLERGQLQNSGILAMLTQFLPEPYAGYLRIIGRYSVIYTTIVADTMTIIFVLGVLAWWNGGAVTA